MFISLWGAFFVKKSKILVIILFLITILYFLCLKLFPSVKHVFDLDTCLDIGICKEGIINMQDKNGKSIPITKENCINNDYNWIEKYKSCDLRRRTNEE